MKKDRDARPTPIPTPVEIEKGLISIEKTTSLDNLRVEITEDKMEFDNHKIQISDEVADAKAKFEQ